MIRIFTTTRDNWMIELRDEIMAAEAGIATRNCDISLVFD